MVFNATWRTEAQTLLKNGAVNEAVAVLKSVAAMGCVSAIVELSRLKWRQGELEDATALIKSAEIEVKDDDVETHWDLHLAYAIGIGPEDRSVRLKLSFDHLRHAAEVGRRPQDLLAVALHFRDGLNEVSRDYVEAKKWFELAAATGDAEAIRMLRAFNRLSSGHSRH